MLPYSSIGDIATTLLQYLAIIGVVGLGCLPLLVISDVRARLGGWPTDRLPVNHLLLVGGIAFCQTVVLIVGWTVLHIGSSQSDPQFRAVHLIAIPMSCPIIALGLGTVGVRPYCRHRSTEQWLTPRTIAGLGVAAVWHIVTLAGAAIVLFIGALFFALPT